MEANVKAIKEAPRLENTSQLKSYLGMINYYHKFLPSLSTVLTSLHKLLAKNWFSEKDQAVHKSKALLTPSTLLVHYNSTKEIVPTCDASLYGVGAVMQ